jgi:hypothetical protein
MTRSYTRYQTHTHLSHAIRIQGKLINIDFARIVYRCRECLGELRKRDAGLVCINDSGHRGFVHRDEAAQITQEQAEQLEQVEAVYEVIDGQVVAKEGRNAH